MPKYNEYPVVTAVEVDADDLLLWEIDGVTKKMTRNEFIALLVNAGSGQYNQSVAFSASIPFNYAKTIMTGYNMTLGAITLTPNTTGAINGGETILPIIADGSVVPDFSAFTEVAGSNGYDNTSGVTNYFQFVKVGAKYLLTVTQEVGAVPVDTTAPTILSAQIANAERNKIEITFNEDVQPTVPAGSSIVATGTTTGAQTATSMTRTAVDKIKVTFAANWVGGEDVTFTYTAPGTNPIKDTAGNNLANVTAHAVTNNIVSTVLQFVPVTHWTANNDGYIVSGGTEGTNTCFSAQPITDGHSLQFKLVGMNGGTNIVFGLASTPAAGANSTAVSTHKAAFISDNTVQVEGATYDIWATGYLYRIRNASGVYHFEKSTNGGTSWTSVQDLNPPGLSQPGDVLAGTWYAAFSMNAGIIEDVIFN